MAVVPVIVDDRGEMAVRVVEAEYMDFGNIEVAPSKGDFPRTIDPSTVPYTYGDCYSRDAFFPGKDVELREPYIIRDFRGQNVVFYPFQYNAASKTLRVYYNVTVEVYKTGENGHNELQGSRRGGAKINSDFDDIYLRHFVNYEQKKKAVAGAAKYTAVSENGDMLIICYDAFIDAMNDFVTWKKTRGVNTTIVGTSTAGNTYTDIKNYIQSQYAINNNLTYVLLVGGAEQLPGYRFQRVHSFLSGLSDNMYGQILGDDIYNDLLVGRFSAQTAAQAALQAQKVDIPQAFRQ